MAVLDKTKENLKKSSVIRDNYRRLRKIFLHIIHGRFISALKLANHYNPVYRIMVRTSFYNPVRERKNLAEVLENKFSYPDDSGKYKVSLVIRDGNFSPRSSSFIRLISPLTDESVRKDINLSLLSAQKLPKELDADFVIVQRTAFDKLHQATKLVEKAGTAKLIVDNDDAFHEISEEHPEYTQQIKRVEAMEYLLEKADRIWVSTEKLIDKKYADKTQVVINTLDSRLWGNRPAKTTKGPLKMVYMGTATHDADLEMILPALDKVQETNPFQLFTIGVSQNVPERAWITQLNTPRFGSLYPTFVDWFQEQGPFDIGLSPLVDSAFNRSKSDIKCLDYFAAGIMPVVSDILPYQSKEIEPFIIKVKNDEKQWVRTLAEIAKDPEKFRAQKSEIISKAQEYLWNERSSTNTVKILLKNFQDLK